MTAYGCAYREDIYTSIQLRKGIFYKVRYRFCIVLTQ